MQTIKAQLVEMQKQAKLVLSLREANKKMEKALKINSQENNRLNEQINRMTEDLQHFARERQYMQLNEASFMQKQEMIRQLVEQLEEFKEAAAKSESHSGIEEYQDRIGQLEASLEQKEIVIAQLYERISMQSNRETAQSLSIEELNSKIAEYERYTNDLRESLALKEQDLLLLNQLNSNIANYETEISDLKQTIANKDQ